MELEERTKLRDKLFDTFDRMSVFIGARGGFLRVNRRALVNALQDTTISDEFKRYVSEFRTEEEAVYCILRKTDFTEHFCPMCGKLCTYTSNNHYGRTCGDDACVNDTYRTELVKQKRANTNMQRYGVENAMQCEQFQRKAANTNKQRYGTECTLQSPQVKAKFHKSAVEHCDADSLTQNVEVQEKCQQTNIEYKIDAPAQDAEVHEKAATTRERHADSPMQSKDVVNSIISANLERYIAACTIQRPDVQHTIDAINMERYGTTSPSQSEQVRAKISDSLHTPRAVDTIPIESIFDAAGIKEKDVVKVFKDDDMFASAVTAMHQINADLLCIGDVCAVFHVGYQCAKERIEALNLLDHFTIYNYELEMQMAELLEESKLSYMRHNRSILVNEQTGAHREIDFLVGNIGIEVDDTRSHHVGVRGMHYHRDKSLDAYKKGIRLIHVWEWEMIEPPRWERFSRWLLNLLNKEKSRIFARKCEVREVGNKDEKRFVQAYHLQGHKRSEVCYGLYYNNELVQLMSFCTSRFNKNYEWELLRLCTKYGVTVVGGAQKLLKHFIRSKAPKSIISYCDLAKFNGDVYERLGFKLVKRNSPQATWFNPSNGKHFSQTSLNMLGADKLIGTNYGRGTDNETIARAYGYREVYNCGMAVYALYCDEGVSK